MASVRHLELWKIHILDTFVRAESKSASAHQIWSKSDDRRPRYCDKTEIKHGRRRHVEFTSGLLFDTFWRLGRQNASAYQISCKSVNILGNYDVSYIFKMASVRNLEFWKIQILDKFSRAESKSASSHKICSKLDDRQPRYCDKTEIQYGRRRHVEFTFSLLFDTFWKSLIILNPKRHQS